MLKILILAIKKKKDVIFAGPVFKKKTKIKKKNISQNYEKIGFKIEDDYQL